MSREQSSSGMPLTVWGLIAGAFYFFFIRPQLLKWGSRLGESQRRLPGDELIPQPNAQSTRAIDIDSPPEAVWPWLAQMGRDRTGWYALDAIDNDNIPSATVLRQDLPAPQAGMALDHGYHVMDVVPNRLLLIGGYDLPNSLGTASDVSILYLLERKPDGSTRLLIRMRAYSYGTAGQFYNLVYEPVEFLMTYRQLEGIKTRAETMAHLESPAPLEHELSLN
jgi:hypothetical protein